MNKKQHLFIWIGIALITFMAVMFDSNLMWLIAAIALIAESIYICKDETIPITLLILAIILFVILFISNDLKREIQQELGFRHRPAAPIIRK